MPVYPSSSWRWPPASRIHTALPEDDAWTTLEHDLETLADILPLVLAHDERPNSWLAPAFVRQVAFIRSRVAGVARRRHLAARLGPDLTEAGPGRFERAARRIAVDPTAVALAIRYLEIEADTRLPSWSDILRRRTIQPAPTGPGSPEAALWFG